ncbi:glutamine--fructose-6-phosphate transaminase (isomerizing), partial [bacterium]|nr:glutamine--fructose-6-phosphate transaminase (isomerizing) [bacterium]
MCGIVGLASTRDAAKPSLDALKRLEYRGYDSVGLGLVDKGLRVWRKEGRIQAFLDEFAGGFPPGATAIAHTRWATHGAPVESNAHPIGDDGIAVVHNGIIENEGALRAELAAEGVVFATETDTEVVLRLLLAAPGSTLEERLPAVLARLEGAYALAIVSESEPGRVYFARRHSPLVLGLGEGETWLASDLSAILPETRNAVFLEENRHGWLTPEGCVIIGPAGIVEEPVVSVLPFNPVAAQKGPYSHFMQKEIHEQPRAFTETLGELLSPEGVALPAPVAEILAGAKRLRLIACGTSWHAALACRIWVEDLAGVPCEVEIASEALARPTLPTPGLVAIAVSQSGETFDTVAAARALKDAGVPLLALVNTQGSTLERMADGVLRTRAGPEIGVAATKTHTAQLLVLYLVALHLAKSHGGEVAERVSELRRLPAFLERVLAESEGPVRDFARKVAGTKNALFL